MSKPSRKGRQGNGTLIIFFVDSAVKALQEVRIMRQARKYSRKKLVSHSVRALVL